MTELDSYCFKSDRTSPESTTRLMCEMRNSLQREDWATLAKLIALFADVSFGKIRWYPTVLRVRTPFGYAVHPIPINANTRFISFFPVLYNTFNT